MTPLHRHQIAWLSREGWQHVLARPWDDDARQCLKHWAGHRLPLVVTRQSASLGEGQVALGLCAPARWAYRRLALQLPQADVAYFDEFPLLERVVAQLPASARAGARSLAQALHREGLAARAYGSHGWQALTGLEHLRAGSDLDLWLGVAGTAEADAAVALLARWSGPVRLDGELVFPGDTAVAWREWQAWREGRTRGLLVKRLQGASTVQALAAFEPLPVAA
ncbi:MAG: malonate decarboxylase holo-[acyl-carrier-protein] synthase [Pelomonas sp.]|nr:malonate decarboxylase holo-[acyl-carrier-protein] synthase [Roseateles sp.]